MNKKTRFDVFKRDSFACQYCGSSPPAVVLEIDHVQPKSKDGSNDTSNLVTSCFDCNRGKASELLSVIPSSLVSNMEAMQEKEAQVKEYNKLLRRIQAKESKSADKVSDVYSSFFSGWVPSDNFKNASIKKFLRNLPEPVVIEAMEYACSRFPKKRDVVLRYFCGVCWGKIKDDAE